MDEHKQPITTVHEVGSTIHPLSPADLTSDFTSEIDPDAQPVEAPMIEPAGAVAEAPKETTESADLGAPSMPTSSASSPKNSSGLWSNPAVKWGSLAGGLIILLGVGYGVAMHFGVKAPQTVTTSQADKSTLYIDTKKQAVGVKSSKNPDGLEVQATATTTAQGSANVRMGLVNGTDPSLLFEDGKANTWQVLGVDGSLQFIQGTTTRAKLDQNALSLTNAINIGGMTNANGGLTTRGDTTLGDQAGNTLTIQATKVNAPNGLNIINNSLSIANTGQVAIGSTASPNYKLLVNGNTKVNGSLYLDNNVFAGAGNAKGPAFTFGNNTNTGIYQVAINVVGVSANGSQVLQIQQGSVLTTNGANLEVDGYVRAGRGGNSPAWQVQRYTGTLDGSGSATVGDGVGNDNTRALSVSAFYRGNSNEAVPMSVDSVNGSTVHISNGIPGRQYRVTLMYSQDSAGW